jgi:hypothetical protein
LEVNNNRHFFVAKMQNNRQSYKIIANGDHGDRQREPCFFSISPLPFLNRLCYFNTVSKRGFWNFPLDNYNLFLRFKQFLALL